MGVSGAPAPWRRVTPESAREQLARGSVPPCFQVPGGEFGRKLFVRPSSNPARDADEFQLGLAGTSACKVTESIRFPAQKLMR